MKIPALMEIDADFWMGRRVLVTGHTGFKGAWLSLWLQSLGADVTGLARGVPTRPSLYELADVTSDKCYENPGGGSRRFAEDDPLGGSDPYSSSKACAELVARAYRRSFFSGGGTPRVGTARAGNVIGGGDWGEDRLVPDTIRAGGMLSRRGAARRRVAGASGPRLRTSSR